MYTTEQLKHGEGLSNNRPMKAYSRDGRTWYTCELSESIGGEVKYVYTVPPTTRGGWKYRA